RVRTSATGAPAGLARGTAVVNTGPPIAMPTGPEIRGRLFNVVGQAIDGLPQPAAEGYRAIHQAPPPYEDLATSVEMFETGIKVIDLIQHYALVVEICLLVGAYVGQRVLIQA